MPPRRPHSTINISVIIIIIAYTDTAIKFTTWEPLSHELGDDLALLVDEDVFRLHVVLELLEAILDDALVLDGRYGQHRVATLNGS